MMGLSEEILMLFVMSASMPSDFAPKLPFHMNLNPDFVRKFPNWEFDISKARIGKVGGHTAIVFKCRQYARHSPGWFDPHVTLF